MMVVLELMEVEVFKKLAAVVAELVLSEQMELEIQQVEQVVMV